MKKYIVPTKYEMRDWRFLFEEVYRTEEFQDAIVRELVDMALWLAVGKIKNEALLSLHEQVFVLTNNLVGTGLLTIDSVTDADIQASRFCYRLAKYLLEIGIIEKEPSTMKFEGFLGLNIIIKILDDNEIDETDERVCLSG